MNRMKPTERGIKMPINEKYSYKDYTNVDYSGLDLTDMNGTTIQGTCFYHDGYPFIDMSQLGLSKIILVNCNLDNVIVPENCTMINCSNRFIRSLDGEDWLCSSGGAYVEKLNG